MGLSTDIKNAINALSAADKADFDKVWDAIGSVLDVNVAPVGSIIPFGKSTAPTGYLNCDGSAVSRTTYADLFTVIGTTFGVGNGTTTFNVPDLRGIFPRGSGTHGSLQDANGAGFAATLGTYSNDKVQGHKHKQGGYKANVTTYQYLEWGSYNPGSPPNYEVQDNAAEGDEVLPYTSPADYDDGTNGTPRVGNETNPANVGVNYIIKI